MSVTAERKKQVMTEFATSEADTGSPEVQVAVLVAQQPEDIEADQERSHGQWDDYDADEKSEQLRLQRQNGPLRTRRGTCRLPPTFVGGLGGELYLVPISAPI